MPKAGPSLSSDVAANLSARAAKRILSQAFKEAGLPFAEDDALEIILAATGFDKTALILRGEDPLTAESYTIMESYMARRLMGEPVDHILGWREFYGRRFTISKEVLSPRADTETLIRGALQRIDKTSAVQILDLGTGSGAIGLTLLSEVPDAHLIATDISDAALSIAKSNADGLKLKSRVVFRQGEWWDAVPAGHLCDMIVSNPPYISQAVMKTLDRDVLDYDPDVALRGGADGLDAYRRILAGAQAHLKPKGWLGLEIGYDQARDLTDLLRADTWVNISIDKDLGGLDRVVWAQNSAE